MKVKRRVQKKTNLCSIQQKKKMRQGIMPRVLQNIENFVNRRITRSLRKSLEQMNNFTVVEDYKCMPLLGDEENIVNWEVHVAKYSVRFN